MAGQGHSSASTPQPTLVDVGNGISAAGEAGLTTWVRTYTLTHRPRWEDLFAAGKDFYDHIDKNFSNHFKTASSSSRIVATLCYTHPGGYILFQSTIPRGVWRRFMKDHGSTVAPRWYAAAYSIPQNGKPFKEAIHAEDSAEFLCDWQMGGFNSGNYESPRLIVYGKKGGTDKTTQVKVCDDPSGKNPHCQMVADLLGIQYPAGRTPAAAIDAEEVAAMQPASTMHTTTLDEYNANKGKSTTIEQYYASVGNSTTWDQYYGGGGGSGSNTGGNNNRGDNARSRGGDRSTPRSGKQDDLSNLTQSMSKLRLGSGGGSNSSSSTHTKSNSLSAARPSKALPTTAQAKPSAAPQTRPSTASQAKPSAASQARPSAASRASTLSATSQAQLSTRTSASRPSASVPPPVSRGPTGRGK